jgi:hypothetical protein
MFTAFLLSLMSSVSGTTKADGCVAAKRLFRQSEVIWKQDLIPAPCPSNPQSAVLWDRTKNVMVAAQETRMGTLLGRVSGRPRPFVVEGEELNLIIRMGAISIERPVTVLTKSKMGAPILVRTNDGKIFSAAFDNQTDLRAGP